MMEIQIDLIFLNHDIYFHHGKLLTQVMTDDIMIFSEGYFSQLKHKALAL